MAIKPVKHFLSSHAGAPVLSGTAGSLIAVLDACLVNGFNLLTLDSLVIAGNVLTGTKAGHGFVVDQVIVTSANEATLIGEWTITSVTSNTFSAAAAGVADVTGTGTLTAKVASAGWTKIYSGTNTAVYRPSDVTRSGCVLRVDDTGTTSARVVGYESMTDVDTGTGPFPNTTQQSGGGYWYKSQSANATTRAWVIVGDALMFYAFTDQYSTPDSACLYAFGDYPSEKSGDAYNCLLTSYTNVTYMGASGRGGLPVITSGDSVCPMYLPRSYTQIGSPITGYCTSISPTAMTNSGGSNGLVYPAPTNNGLIITKPLIREAAGPVRCKAIPGLYHTPQSAPLAHLDKVSSLVGLENRKVLAIRSGANSTESRVFLDITGPWR